MCGRYTIRVPARLVAEEFGLFEVPEMAPRYNVAPTQPVPAVRAEGTDEKRALVMLRWGLVPSWADDLAIGNRMINARSETVGSRPAFRGAFKGRRCLVVADGFYEWKKVDGGKQPYYIRRKDQKPFGLAGLWERWDKGSAPVESCTILTTQANALMSPLHDRMPVIIPHERYGEWLAAGTKADALNGMLVPADPEGWEAYPVSKVVNSPANERASCIEPLAGPA